MLTTFAGSLVTLLICMIFGIVGRKLRLFSDDSDRTLSTLLVKFTLPATIFMSMLQPFSRTLLAESALTILIITIVFSSGLAVGALLSKLMKCTHKEKRIWQFSLVFPNVAFMGFPIIQSVFGNEGMIYASMVVIVFNIMVFSLGVYLIKSKKGQATGFSLKPVLLAPAFIAVYIGFFFFLTGLRLPFPVERGVELIGNMTTPIAMILVGSLLVKTIRQHGLLSLVKDWRVYPIVAARLVLIPVATFFIINPWLSNPVMVGVIVILAAMPVAAITAIFAEQYDGDTPMSVKTITMSNIFCLTTIPLLSLLLR